VTTEFVCAWSASADVSWISELSPSTGQGAGQVEFLVTANPAPTARQGDIVVNGQRAKVGQEPAPCRFDIAPGSQVFGAGGGTGAAAITTASGCSWSAASGVSWVAITSGAIGNGSGTISFQVAPNSGAARSGSLILAAQTFTITQVAGVPPASACVYSITPTSQSLLAAGGAGVPVAVGTDASCTWTVTSHAAWITITSGASGSGNGTVNFTVAANTGSARTGTLTIAGQTFTLTQGAACSYSISPTSESIVASGGAGAPVAVSTATGCAWTATSNAAWITITSGASRSGNGTVNFTVAANTGSARTGTLTIAGNTLTVDQAKH